MGKAGINKHASLSEVVGHNECLDEKPLLFSKCGLRSASRRRQAPLFSSSPSKLKQEVHVSRNMNMATPPPPHILLRHIAQAAAPTKCEMAEVLSNLSELRILGGKFS